MLNYKDSAGVARFLLQVRSNCVDKLAEDKLERTGQGYILTKPIPSNINSNYVALAEHIRKHSKVKE
jgi:hypothetical protein